MLKEIGHYSLENPASVFDEEALTALQLAGRTAAKVNEVVKAQNNLEKEVDNRLDNMENVQIPLNIKQEVLHHINQGEFDQAIDKYSGGLAVRVDSLAAAVTPGLPSGDVELIDARLSQDGRKWNNTGNHVRAVENLAAIVAGSAVPVGTPVACTELNGWVDHTGNWNPETGGNKCVQIPVEPGEVYTFFSDYGYNMPAAVAQKADGGFIHAFMHTPYSRQEVNFDQIVVIPDGCEKLTVNRYANARLPISIVKVNATVPAVTAEYVNNLFTTYTRLINVEERLTATETNLAMAIRNGETFATGDNQHQVFRFEVEEGKFYRIKSGASFLCNPYVFYDKNGNVVGWPKRAPETDYAEFNEDVVAPARAEYVLVGHYGNKTPTFGVLRSEFLITGGSGGNAPTLDSAAKPWAGLKWLVIGDSITENNDWTSKHYYDYIAEKTGIQVTVKAWGGMGFCRRSNAGIFYEALMSLDTQEHYDVITIMGSYNDLTLNAERGDVGTEGIYSDGESINDNTVMGWVRKTLRFLRESFPDAIIGVMSPTMWASVGFDTNRSAFAVSWEYETGLRDVTDIEVVPFKSLHNILNPSDPHHLEKYYKNDPNGVHPDADGHRIIAGPVLAFLTEMLGGF